MFRNLFVVQESKVLRRPLLWIEIAVVSAIAVMMPLALRLVPSGEAGMAWPGGVIDLLGMLANPEIGGVVIIVLAGAVTAQEYAWRTVHHMLSHGVSRPAFFGATFAAVAVPLLLIITIPLLIGGSVIAGLQFASAGGMGLGDLDYAGLVVSIAAAIYSLLPYAAFAFLLAVIGRSPVLALGAGLGAVLGDSLALQISMSLGGVAAEVARFLPSAVAVGLTNPNGDFPISLLTGISAVAAAGAYIALFLGLAFVKFSKQDMTE